MKNKIIILLAGIACGIVINMIYPHRLTYMKKEPDRGGGYYMINGKERFYYRAIYRENNGDIHRVLTKYESPAFIITYVNDKRIFMFKDTTIDFE